MREHNKEIRSHSHFLMRLIIWVLHLRITVLQRSNSVGDDVLRDDIEWADMICPVCGYYCLGKGGYGCIDKPSFLHK